jgi:hypothetical protein
MPLTAGHTYSFAGLYSALDKYDHRNWELGAVAMSANLGGAAFARAVREEFKPADFSVVVKRRGSPPKPWRWEIYCACKAVPIERSPIFFGSATAAAKEGKKALTHLLAR